MRRNLLTSAAAIAALMLPGIPPAFANSNAGKKLFICTTPQPTDIATAVIYAALAWVQIKGVGAMGETGSTTNILTYDTWDTTVIQKAKGMTDAGSPTIEVARISSDPGQIALRAAAKTNANYAFKLEGNDSVDGIKAPTIIYNRGLVTGPSRPNGRNEDFDLEVFTLGLQQEETVVPAVV